MPQLQSDIAQIVAVFVECIFYGIYLVTFAASLRSIASSRPELSWASRFKHQRLMLIIVLLLFIFSTLNLALGLVRILAFLRNDVVNSGAVQHLGQDWLNVLKPLCVNVQTVIADSILIYRCWIVYSKSLRVVILPIILYLGGLACTIVQGTLQSNKRFDGNGGPIFLVSVGFWISTISLNIYATSMIVLCIWRVESESRGGNTLTPLYGTSRLSRLQTVMKTVIESGLLYTVTSTIVFITLLTSSNSMFITSAVDIQVIGIAFNLILIRAVQPSQDTVTSRSGNAVETTLNFAHEVRPSDAFSRHDSQGLLAGPCIDSKIIIVGDPQAGGVEDKQ